MKLRSSFRGSVNSWDRGAGCSWNVLCPESVFAGRDSGPRLWPGIICSQTPIPGSLHQEFLLRANHGAFMLSRLFPCTPLLNGVEEI